MKWPGVYRVFPQSPIVLADYDYAKQKIGPFRFQPIYGYAEDLVRKQENLLESRYSFMFGEMLKYKSLLAIVLVNSSYYLKCYVDTVEIVNLKGEALEREPGLYDYTSMVNEDVIPVGFEKTYCKTVDVLITPGRIYYSPKRKAILYKEEWVEVDHEPVKFTGKSLYKILVSEKTADGIVKVNSSEHISLKGRG